MQFKENAIKFKWIHAANSAGAMFQPSAIYNLVRPGISIYGLNPSKETKLPDQFKPALSWKTILTSVKVMPPGSGISYGHKYITDHEERIGTISVGYGDGYRRTTGNEVLVRGIRVPVIGVVCMDQCIISLDRVPDAQAGDEVVLIGKQEGEEISAVELAGKWQTIVYEPICGLMNRIPRIYINQMGEA
jgi:alanine racemase